ncbi:SAM-dependent chlorinase/fluorinase [Maridesulfovibrio sp.]|uniref:SAM hydrolase/SAM-dependent halogenase family protein n=1 Tax=Maridesulfovibrio sp. TaxID=2795000 RepID=UPI002A189B63|nr:SAM-dependent chlorinase/fluorinase [Maridesulfovibrio sp.]
MGRPIALLTDFGLDDPYVGQMKGVLAARAPESPVIDVSHGVEPFCISQAAFFLAAAMEHFPGDTVFIVVVDPGVGSGRRIIGAEFGGRTVLAPDNGVLELAEDKFRGTAILTDLSEAAARMHSSATFHGRDIFAPIAAEIVGGVSLEELGPKLPLRDMVRTGMNRPHWRTDGVLATVLHKDRFGNLVLNIPDSQNLPERMSISPDLLLSGNDSCCIRRVSCYAELESGVMGLIAGSQGYYELAVNRGAASEMIGLEPGDTLFLEWNGRKPVFL